MTSFLPLIEAFLALALTMLVLTTGVSSLAGTWQRALRARARGLRSLLQAFFHLALRDYASPTPASVARFVGEMSLQPQLLADIAVLPDDAAKEGRYLALLPDLAGADQQNLSWGAAWASRSRTLDTLSEEEFKTRFRASTIGRAMAQTLPAVDFDAKLADLHTRFVAYGHAATEEFARNARLHSTVFALLLALGANIDAFNLLETYLANPALRAAVIEKYEKIGTAPATPPAQTGSATTPVQQIEDLRAFAADLAGKDAQALRLIDDKARLATNAVQASQTAYDEARQVVTDATTNFPVGWDRYPGCAPKGDTQRYADPRCAGIRIGDRDASLAERIGHAFSEDGRQAWRWLIGVFLTIVMLGLGAPFWIQTVNGLLRARDLVRSGRQAGAGTPGKPPASDG